MHVGDADAQVSCNLTIDADRVPIRIRCLNSRIDGEIRCRICYRNDRRVVPRDRIEARERDRCDPGMHAGEIVEENRAVIAPGCGP